MSYYDQLLGLNGDDLAYPRTELISWVANFVSICQKSGLTVEIDHDGLPLNFTRQNLLSAEAAAQGLLFFVEQSVSDSLPRPPTDWTQNNQYQANATVPRIELGLSVLDTYQAEPLAQRINPFIQAVYPVLLGLVMAQAVDVNYQSVQQASALRQRFHGHLVFIERELLANQNSDAIRTSACGDITNALRDLLVITQAAAEDQLATLPHIVQTTLKREQPLRYLLWQNRQGDDLEGFMQRNGLLHPLFIPADRKLELLKYQGEA